MKSKFKDQGLYEFRREHDACGIGAVVNISGQKSHTIIDRAKEILLNLHHRGAAAADEVTGDGAGILIQIPHDFFVEKTAALGFTLPDNSKYGVGMIFLPNDKELAEKCRQVTLESVHHYGMKILGWRDVPVDNKCYKVSCCIPSKIVGRHAQGK